MYKSQMQILSVCQGVQKQKNEFSRGAHGN